MLGSDCRPVDTEYWSGLGFLAIAYVAPSQQMDVVTIFQNSTTPLLFTMRMCFAGHSCDLNSQTHKIRPYSGTRKLILGWKRVGIIYPVLLYKVDNILHDFDTALMSTSCLSRSHIKFLFSWYTMITGMMDE